MTQCKLKRNIQQIAAKYQNNPDLIIYLKKNHSIFRSEIKFLINIINI